MNQKFAEISILFHSAGIDNFVRLPEETVVKGRFALLFREYNRYMEAARVQGFHWSNLIYRFPDGKDIRINHDEHLYNTLLQRYKELFANNNEDDNNSNGGDLPYEIDPYLSEIDTEKIDTDYMNRNFERYIKALDQPNITSKELSQLLNDLSASFASLPQEEQKYAEIFLHDVQSRNIELEVGKTFRDYITDYMSNEKDRVINEMVIQLGLDGELLKAMLNQNLTEQDIDVFGRFSRLKNSIDRKKAKTFIEKKLGKSVSMLQVNVEMDKMLRKFILTGSINL